jgi:16S rRNA (uracil1498-N3)-methyltransferase
MRLHRFIVPFALQQGRALIEAPDTVHQICNVLRLSEGDRIILLDGKLHEAEALIGAAGKNSLAVTVGSVQLIRTEPRRKVVLFCSLLKRENFEWVSQKATEVGVAAIVPVLAGRTVKTGVKIDRIHRIVREAVEQCGRGVVPEVKDPLIFPEALRAAPRTNVFFHLGAQDESWPQEIAPSDETGIWIGPEGGWTEEEAGAARERGFIVGSLGSLALRAETAAVVGAYLAVHA